MQKVKLIAKGKEKVTKSENYVNLTLKVAKSDTKQEVYVAKGKVKGLKIKVTDKGEVNMCNSEVKRCKK